MCGNFVGPARIVGVTIIPVTAVAAEVVVKVTSTDDFWVDGTFASGIPLDASAFFLWSTL